MEVHLLGAVELSARGSVVRLGSDRERCLLASLALDVGRPVSQDVLVGRLWDDEPPKTARANLHTYISRLRHALRTVGAATAQRSKPPAVITLRAHTYTLEAESESVDWHRFVRLSREAAVAARAGEDTRALDGLDAAEGLWIGEALAGLPGIWPQSARDMMAERRLATVHTRLALRLRLGHFADVVSEASELTGRHPLDETLARQLMVALYAVGRHAESLAVYQRARTLFRAQLGSEPGEPLARVHGQILRRAALPDLIPGLRPPAPRPSAPPTAEPVEVTAPPVRAAPRHLPSRRQELVGREQEISRLLRAGNRSGGSGWVIAIEAISGMAGVGKSTLALHAAHRLGDSFPDGSVFVDLRGHSVAQSPLTTEEALAALLRGFEVPPQEIRPDLQARTAQWQTLVAGKRAVIVLDDAAGTRQVLPLLPDGSPSLVLITSRHRLVELPAAHPLFVDVLPLDDAVGLFQRLVGPERATDTDRIADIVTRCGLLPLAVEITASRFKARPSWDLDHLMERLSRSPGRLQELRDGYREVAVAFEMSYHALTPEQRSAFRRLSLHPGPDFGLYAAAAVIGEPLDRTERLIEDLLEYCLLQEPRTERYRFHDLLGEFAATLAGLEEPAEERDAALRRLGGYALRAADRADRLLHPHRNRLGQLAPQGRVSVPRMADAAAARTWLGAELEGALTVERGLRQQGHVRQAAQLAHALGELADSEGYWREGVTMHEAAAAHWRAADQPRAEARALLDLATAHARVSRYPQSAEAVERALALARGCEDDVVTAEALGQLGVLQWHVGEYDAGLVLHQECLELRRRSGDIRGCGRSLNNVGIVHLSMGDYRGALENFTAALAAVREAGDVELQATFVNNLAEFHLRTGDTDSARACFKEALAIGAVVLSETDRAVIRTNLAVALGELGDPEAALELGRTALTTFRRTGGVRHEAHALNVLGKVLLGAGLWQEAKAHHEDALRLARGIGASHEEAAALRGTGTVERALGEFPEARMHLEAAAALARRIQAPEEEALATDVLARLLWDEGRAEEARALWRHALALFEPLNPLEADRIRRSLARDDQDGSGWWPKEA
ncbi:tetratricopeptide repeat protein [Streptomyces sp. NPDC003300]|uniref:AfsR/SARP family transcriptional regulator n=1 Tax=unclassified Streptomyces TaxID=2593676 RepID=UPI0033B19936